MVSSDSDSDTPDLATQAAAAFLKSKIAASSSQPEASSSDSDSDNPDMASQAATAFQQSRRAAASLERLKSTEKSSKPESSSDSVSSLADSGSDNADVASQAAAAFRKSRLAATASPERKQSDEMSSEPKSSSESGSNLASQAALYYRALMSPNNEPEAAAVDADPPHDPAAAAFRLQVPDGEYTADDFRFVPDNWIH